MVLDSQVSLHSIIFIIIVRKKLTEDMRFSVNQYPLDTRYQLR